MIDRETVLVVDDDKEMRESLRALVESAGYRVRTYNSASSLLADDLSRCGCLITDVRMPGMGGLELQEEIVRRNIGLPVIVITGHSDMSPAIRAMQMGAIEFLLKPIDDKVLLESVNACCKLSRQFKVHAAEASVAHEKLALLTPRERDVFDWLVLGQSNKETAHKLKISGRTVEVHRTHIFRKMNTRNLSELMRVSLAAAA